MCAAGMIGKFGLTSKETYYAGGAYYGGAYALTEVSSGHVAAQGSFSFAPHWRATLVTDAAVSLTGETPAKVELVVTNQRGRNVSYTFDCGE